MRIETLNFVSLGSSSLRSWTALSLDESVDLTAVHACGFKRVCVCVCFNKSPYLYSMLIVINNLTSSARALKCPDHKAEAVYQQSLT